MQPSLAGFLGKKKRAEEQGRVASVKLQRSNTASRGGLNDSNAQKSSSKLLQALNSQYRRSEECDVAQPGPGSAASCKLRDAAAVKEKSTKHIRTFQNMSEEIDLRNLTPNHTDPLEKGSVEAGTAVSFKLT